MKTSYNYELIEDFLDGILEAKAAAEVKQLLDTDEDARDIANGILVMKEHFSNDQDVDQYLDERLKKAQKEIKKNTVSKKPSSLLKIAASIVLVAASGLTFYQLSKSNLQDLVGDQLESPYEASVAMRSSELKTGVQNALIAYESGQYEEAFNLLKAENSAQAAFFSGLSLLYQDRGLDAIPYLESTKLANSRYEEQSRWYLSLAYIASEKLDEGEKLLLRIKFTENHFKQKEAIEILEFLND